ncbi:efflux RND transporter periplasmic adaptor subunit [Heyndrickxia sp. NPDC080065]|uniref:efflux RND transporter periplasmic adaptor subunit n=1 Tax=Heyndrickxia sp. NPDC080065 TaxID=3390568 RepID=UPI003CFE824C
MKKWPYILALIILFIGVNIFLIEKKNNKIDRVHLISQWDTVKKDDLIESFPSNGVVAPSEYHYVYVDKEAGFKQFLVKEGDTVETGTPLFEYSTSNIEIQKNLLDTEIERLKKQISSIDTHIQNLQSLLSSAKADERTDKSKDKKDKKGTANPKVVSYSIEMQINDKELEKEKLEQQVEQYESQKSNYDDEASNLKIVSNTSGIVKKISYNLKNPVITIVSNTPIIQGKLTEAQLSKVESGMKTVSTSSLFKGKIDGVIEKVSTTPKEKPKVEKKSFYPYEISLSDHDQKIQEGFHVTTQIITKEVKDANIVEKGSIVNNNKQYSLWVLNRGLLEKKNIKLGLQVNGKQQVESGVELGNFYLNNPSMIDQSGSFITHLKAGEINKSAIKDVGVKSALKYVLIGILQR